MSFMCWAAGLPQEKGTREVRADLLLHEVQYEASWASAFRGISGTYNWGKDAAGLPGRITCTMRVPPRKSRWMETCYLAEPAATGTQTLIKGLCSSE